MPGNKNSGRLKVPMAFAVARATPQGAERVDIPVPRGVTGKAKWLWQFVVDNCQGYVSAADEPALRVLCETYALYCTQVQSDPEGALKTSEKLYKYFGAFGMTPVDRHRMSGQKGQESAKPSDERASRYLAG